MGSEWKKVRLSEIGKIVTGKTPPTKNKENFGDKYPFITPRDMRGQKHIRYTERYLSDIGFNLLESVAIPPNSICVTCIGSMGKIAMSSELSITNQQINSIIPNDEYDPSFIYYCLKPKEDYFKSISGGTTMPILNKTDFSNIEIEVPPLPEQQKIASILSAFDDKIELNNEMNKTLEEIAQAIFKHWFIDFEFPNENGEPYKSSGGEFVDSELGPIPRGWKVIKISEICEIQIGGDWGKEDKFEGAVPVYCLRGVDLQKLKENGYSNELPLRWVKKSSLEKRMLSSKDILIAGSGIGPVGRTLYFHENITNLYEYPLIYSNFCKRIRAKSEQYAIYIEQILENMYTKGEMALYINGTSVPNLNINGLIEHKVVLPTDDILNKYADFKSKVLARKYSKENLTLSQLRDTLLPKLISGEIRVM